MSLLRAIFDQLPRSDMPVRNVLVGVHWTAVCSMTCGLASSLTSLGPHGQDKIRDVGSLHQKSVRTLAEWVFSENPLEASIGMAALNSFLPVDEPNAIEINAGEILAERGAGKNMTVVGHFPFIDRLRGLAKNFWVLEMRPAPGDLPAESAAEVLPQSDVVAITGTALMNHTMEELLKQCKPGAFILVLGPSTPLTPVWFDYGVSVYSGTRVVDESSALLTIQQGAIFPQVKGVRLVSMRNEK